MEPEKQSFIEKYSLWIITAVTILGAFLRFHNIGEVQLWVDEVALWQRVTLGWHEMFDALLRLRFHGPLYYCMTKIACGFAGTSEASLRFFSALGNTLAIALVYATGKKLLSKEAGLVAAFLFSTASFQIFFAQEARFYGIMTFWGVLSTYLFLVMLEKGRPRSKALYIIASVLMLYNHYYAVFVLLGQNCFMAVNFAFDTASPARKFEFKKLVDWSVTQIIVILLFLPWLLPALGSFERYESAGELIAKPTLIKLFGAFDAYCAYFKPLTVVVSLLGIAGAVSLLKKPDDSGGRARFTGFDSLHLIFWMIFASLFVPFIYSMAAKPIFLIRYTVFASAGFCLLAGAGVSSLRNRPLRYAVLAVLALLVPFQRPFGESNNTFRQWREVSAWMDEKAGGNDILMMAPGHFSGCYRYYSAQKHNMLWLYAETVPENVKSREGIERLTLNELPARAAGTGRVVVFYAARKIPLERIEEALGSEFVLAEEKDFGSGRCIVFSKD